MKRWFGLFLAWHLVVLAGGEGLKAAQEPVVVEAVWLSTAEEIGPEAAWARLAAERGGKPLGDGAFGFSEELFWVRVELCNVDGREEPLVLDIRNPHIDRLDAWLVDYGDELRPVARTGDALRPEERSTPNRRPVVLLPATATCHQVLLRVDKRRASVSIPMTVMTAREFAAFELRVDMIHGGIFAVFLLIIVLGAAGFARFRERRFASYAVYATIRWLYMFLASGYANMTLLAAHPEWTNPLRVAVVLPLVLSLIWFVGDHFELNRLNKRLHRRNRWVMLVVGGGFVVAAVGRAAGWLSVQMVLQGMYLLSFVSLLHLAVVAWAMRRVVRRATGYFVGAFGGSMAVAGYVMLEELGAVPFVDFAVPLALWAALLEVLVLLTGAVQLVMQRLMERQALLLRVEQAESEKMRAFVEGLEEERRRVARELHDDVGADLALISHQIQHPPPLVAALQEVIRSIRRLSSALNPIGIHRQPLDQSLRQLAESYAVLPIQMHLSLDAWPTDAPGRIEFECYRIAQEALQNAVKHARAGQIFLSLRHNPESNSFSLTIEDNGMGFVPAEKSKGQGLRNMQYRANLIGAEWTIDSEQGKGTFVSLGGYLNTTPSKK